MNPNLPKLKPYPFERLAQLKAGVTPPADKPHIALSIGEPRHAPPAFVIDALIRHMDGLASYPQAKGVPQLREAIVNWLNRRFDLAPGMLDPERHVVPVSGTREGLFSFVQAVLEPKGNPLVLMPNPFYQIYEGAAFLAGAEPYYLNTFEENGFLPDLDAVPESIWKRAQVLFLCSPGNPTGAVMDKAYLARALDLADKYDFVIASDECYSEIYFDEDSPPPGLLEVCRETGRDDFRRAVVFHSLSKRSNVPGLRSGFVAGDASIMQPFLLYRTYHGCAMPLPAQLASVEAWNDDAHVVENRAYYRRKFETAMEILAPVMDVKMPPAAFYIWPASPIDDEEFVRRLFAEQNLTLLPGSYLSRETEDGNPGKNRIRISLVPGIDECEDAMRRIREFVETLGREGA
ncbi:MAG TPA: succinyldiaminopimelate transaminase [Gammaproteobacteria bacterium]